MIHEDAQGLLLTTIAAEAATGYDAVVEGLLKYRLDVPQRLDAAVAAQDGKSVEALAHLVKGGAQRWHLPGIGGLAVVELIKGENVYRPVSVVLCLSDADVQKRKFD